MDSGRNRLSVWVGVTTLCILTVIQCQRPGGVRRAVPETTGSWTLRAAAPIDHLDAAAREPMIVEHPDGSLFVSGYGSGVPTLWRSHDGGATWARINVGSKAEGAVGNSDVDLAVARDGTLYFATMVFDSKEGEGRQISIGVSKDGNSAWKWTLLSKTRFDDRPWVKVAPDGTAHVIWNDGRGVCHAVSQDGGLTWTERPRIYPQGGSSHLAVGQAGEVAVRVTPTSASGERYDEGVDLIAVSTDGGMTWLKHEAPGYREWNPDSFPVPRWVEPLAWDARGALYSLWTNLKGIWLARSADQGTTWTTWQLADRPGVAYFPYLAARSRGELAATWFSGWTGTWQAHVARIDVSDGESPPRMVESQSFKPDSWRGQIRAEDPQTPDPAGEYLAVCFLRAGGLMVVSPIHNPQGKRFGFSLWKIKEQHGESRLEHEERSLAKKIDH
jgi:hypothetical protein